jgi:predicted nucleic acid-binding Zn ribbon protein
MATYTYETIPASPDEPVQTCELRQSMRDAAFTHHPDTGEPIRRVITGGLGIMTSGKSGSSAPSGGHRCASGGCGCA